MLRIVHRLFKQDLPIWHLVVQCRDTFLHGHRVVLHLIHLHAFGPIPRDVFCITSVCVISCGEIIDGDRMLALANSNCLRVYPTEIFPCRVPIL